MHRLSLPDVPQFKVPLVGDANTGKTSIVRCFTGDSFDRGACPTVGVATVNTTFAIRDRALELSLWDTAGQEKFRSLVPLYTRNAALIILVFERSCPASFPGLDDWLLRLRDDVGADCPVFLCANKTDLPPAVPEEAIRVWAERNGCPVFFTSALSGEGIGEMFAAVAEQLLARTGERTPLPKRDLEKETEDKCC
jgi:small GTP-binding protein